MKDIHDESLCINDELFPNKIEEKDRKTEKNVA